MKQKRNANAKNKQLEIIFVCEMRGDVLIDWWAHRLGAYCGIMKKGDKKMLYKTWHKEKQNMSKSPYNNKKQ